MAPRLLRQNCKLFKFLLSLNSQKRLGYKENKTWPESLEAILEYWYIERGLFHQIKENLRTFSWNLSTYGCHWILLAKLLGTPFRYRHHLTSYLNTTSSRMSEWEMELWKHRMFPARETWTEMRRAIRVINSIFRLQYTKLSLKLFNRAFPN